MDDSTGKSPDCYNFPAIRDIWKKYKQHHCIHQHDSFKDRKEDVSRKVNNNNRDDHHFSCFKAIILFTAPKKKFVSDDFAINQTTTTSSKTIGFQPTRTSLGKSRSMNHRLSSDQWTKTAGIHRTTSDAGRKTPTNPRIHRTASDAGRKSAKNSGYQTAAFDAETTRTEGFNGRNGSFTRRTPSIARSKSGISVTRSGPIIFSNSSGVLKPPPAEHELECTLEELCHGCIKHIKLLTNVYTNTGRVIQEEKVFKVEVKPGWKTGTRITFQGSCSAGEHMGDVIFIVSEKPHPVFRRNEDNLEVEIEIPLVEALTGCTLTIPSLWDDQVIVLPVDDIIHPGYQRNIVGLGMPNQNHPAQKGDLIVTFLVKYPDTLTLEQRSQISSILSV